MSTAVARRARAERWHAPIRYGLEAGPEVNLLPAINVDNAIALVQGGEIQFKFFVTLPDALLENGKPQPEVTVHILTSASDMPAHWCGWSPKRPRPT